MGGAGNFDNSSVLSLKLRKSKRKSFVAFIVNMWIQKIVPGISVHLLLVKKNCSDNRCSKRCEVNVFGSCISLLRLCGKVGSVQ